MLARCALSGASFALFARRLAERGGENFRVDAMDLRGHGSTRTADDRDLPDTMAKDVADVCARLYRDDDDATNDDGNANAVVLVVRTRWAARWPRGWRAAGTS